MTHTCPACGAAAQGTIRVWEDPTDYDEGEPPDYVGCEECHTMTEFDVNTMAWDPA